jgi:hypothetical protein
MGGNDFGGRAHAPRARRVVAAPVAALLVFGALVAGTATAGASVPATSVGNPGLCFGEPPPGGCAGGTMTARAASGVTLGLSFTATSGLAPGSYISIDANRDAPDTVFQGVPSLYRIHDTSSPVDCIPGLVEQNNAAEVIVPVPMSSDCAADPGDQIIVTIEAVGMSSTVGPVTMQLATEADPAPVDTNAVHLVGPPSAPQNVKTVRKIRGWIKASYDRPASVGGTPITGYTAYCAPSDAPTDRFVCGHFGPTPRSGRLTGLTNGITYDVAITATNAAGESPLSATVSATPATKPSRPLALRTKAYPGSLVVRWKVPTSDGGSPITGYDTYCSTNKNPHPGSTPVGSTGNVVRVTGLTSGTPYYCVVVAVNDVGASPLSAVVTGTPK